MTKKRKVCKEEGAESTAVAAENTENENIVKKKAKKKAKMETAEPDEPASTPSVAAASAGKKKKKKKHRLLGEGEQPEKKLKMKKKLKKVGAAIDTMIDTAASHVSDVKGEGNPNKRKMANGDGEAQSNTLSGKKSKKKKNKQNTSSAPGATSETAGEKKANEKNEKKDKKEKKKKNKQTNPIKESDCPVSEDDSFFAGENDAKHGDKKSVPDHLNPLKVFVGGLPYAATEKGVRKTFAKCGDIERFDMPLNQQGQASGNAFIYFQNEAGVAKALEYHGTEYEGRVIKVMRAQRQAKDKGKGKGKSSKGKAEGNTESKAKSRNDATTVFVGGLPYDTELATLRQDFAECGEIAAVRMVNNPEGAFKGIAFIVFKDEDGVKEALKYDGDNYGGRTLKISRASEKAKDGKGKDGKSKGKGKDGSEKKGVCFKFQKGSCPHGDNCIFAHE